MGQLVGIARREKKRADMELLQSAQVSLTRGIACDFRGRPGKRQVTILASESWKEACDDLQYDLPWHTRRANLLISGVKLQNTRDKIIRIGSATLLINQETDPCERMDEAFPGLEKALAVNWRGGVCCSVVSEGLITVGDEVTIEDV